MNTKQLKTVSADSIIEIQSDLFAKLQNGVISIEVLKKFINMSEKDRNELFGIKTTESISSIEALLSYIYFLFTKKCGNKFDFNPDLNFYEEFNIKKANLENSIDFTYSIDKLKSDTTHKAILSHEKIIKVPLIQALRLVIELIENELIDYNSNDENNIMIFLSTKNKRSRPCILNFYYSKGFFSLMTDKVILAENQRRGKIDHSWERVLLKT